MMASAGIYNIATEQGTTFARLLTWKDKTGTPVSLVNYTARMQVRVSPSSISPVLSLTTENSRIVLGGVLGTVSLTVTDEDMSQVPSGKYYYDLELISQGGVVTKLIKGTFTVKSEVTR